MPKAQSLTPFRMPRIRKLLLLTAGLTLLATAIVVVIAYMFRGELVRNRAGGRHVPTFVAPTPDRMARLTLPAGFRLNVFARDLGSPRMIAVSGDGIVFVTRPGAGDVLALADTNDDGEADRRSTFVQGLPGVHGIALDRERVYLSTVGEVYVVDLKSGGLARPQRMLGDLPPGGYHPYRTLGVGPDGRLYISVGSTCNACVERHRESATVVRVGSDGRGREVFAAGLRNTIGFGWHPVTGEMWGVDNGTDWLGDDRPPEELNLLTAGAHYGWPFLTGRNQIADAVRQPIGFAREGFRAKATGSVLEYRAHSAPIQMTFYTGSSFPPEYRGDAFVAMHGSWNRRPPSGYEIARIRFRDGRPQAFEPFLTGFLIDDETAFARPAGVAAARDGALLVGDEAYGVMYRVSYARY